jgi:hypothetical protein
MRRVNKTKFISVSSCTKSVWDLGLAAFEPVEQEVTEETENFAPNLFGSLSYRFEHGGTN